MCLIELDDGQYNEWKVCTVHVVIVAWCWFVHDALTLSVLTALYIVDESCRLISSQTVHTAGLCNHVRNLECVHCCAHRSIDT